MPDTEEFEDDIAEAMEFPDENGDGIDDRTQRFSNYGNPRRLILEPSNSFVGLTASCILPRSSS